MDAKAINDVLRDHRTSMAISMRYYEDIPARLNELDKHLKTKKQRASMKRIWKMHEKTGRDMTLKNVDKIDEAMRALAKDAEHELIPIDCTKRSKEYMDIFEEEEEPVTKRAKLASE